MVTTNIDINSANKLALLHISTTLYSYVLFSDKDSPMAKRKFTLTSQEMHDINASIKTLESQPKHSNDRLDEL